MWEKNQDEPVILTLSSDDDEVNATGNGESFAKGKNSKQRISSVFSEPINPKEPIIRPNLKYENCKRFHQTIPEFYAKKRVNAGNLKDYFIALHCRNVRIGSYKVIPADRAVISCSGLKVTVPSFAEENNNVILDVPYDGMVKILAHFGGTSPVIFFYISDQVSSSIRKLLKMDDKNGFYFDPCSQEESQKRLTLSLEKIKQETIGVIKNIFNVHIEDSETKVRLPLLEEISQKDANEILVRSSPVEIDNIVIHSKATVSYETKTLLVYPPPPNKGGISISIDDYCCLKEEQFLNDVLIDFYLKWLHSSYLSDADRERTHIFSTFFYKRLTFKPKEGHRSLKSERDSSLNPQERRHARVKSWTKNVDIFSKDFLLVPINEHSHWFLVVICFPGLSSPIRLSDGKPVSFAEATAPSRSSKRERRKRTETIPVIDDEDYSDRDEADGDEAELDFFDDDDDFEHRTHFKEKNNLGAIKQPCILILDSLSGASRGRIVSTLRDYLTVELQLRKKVPKGFAKDTMPGACPKVPQQMNFSDCGLFVLQFAQSFFDRPLNDFRLPIRSAVDWFNQDEVGCKRETVAYLIRSLMDECKPNHGITLPPLFPNSVSESLIKTPLQNSDSDNSKGGVNKDKVVSVQGNFESSEFKGKEDGRTGSYLSGELGEDGEYKKNSEFLEGFRKNRKEITVKINSLALKSSPNNESSRMNISKSRSCFNRSDINDKTVNNSTSLDADTKTKQSPLNKSKLDVSLTSKTLVNCSTVTRETTTNSSLSLLQESYKTESSESSDDEIFADYQKRKRRRREQVDNGDNIR